MAIRILNEDDYEDSTSNNKSIDKNNNNDNKETIEENNSLGLSETDVLYLYNKAQDELAEIAQKTAELLAVIQTSAFSAMIKKNRLVSNFAGCINEYCDTMFPLLMKGDYDTLMKEYSDFGLKDKDLDEIRNKIFFFLKSKYL